MSDTEKYTMLEAVAEARRCLNCKVPQCKRGCPIQQDIPQWIAELGAGNLGNAMKLINAKSNLPAVCGRVCAHERQCQGHCILEKKNAHINIGRLEMFIADFDTEMGLSHITPPPMTGGRVAVIGSGPAGLTVAGELARRGIAAEVFEMEQEPGGVLMFGIPEYRLPKEVVCREIDKINRLGVKFHCSTTIGKDYTIDDLFKQGFDAVFIGTGTGRPKNLDIPGCNLHGVRQAIYFLRRYSLYNQGYIGRDEVLVSPGHRVFVIGCGNTAMDAARTAARLGAAEVTVVYHRGIDRMSALKAEYDDAVNEGVKFLWNSSITNIHDTDGVLDRVTIDTPDGEKIMAADRVIMAVGSTPASRIVSTTEGIDTDAKGYVLTRDIPYGMTSRKAVFAGGDVTNRQPATVVHAMQEARMVAESIAGYLEAIRLLEAVETPLQQPEKEA